MALIDKCRKLSSILSASLFLSLVLICLIALPLSGQALVTGMLCANSASETRFGNMKL